MVSRRVSRAAKKAPDIVVKRNIGFVSQSLPRFDKRVEGDRAAMKKLGIKDVDPRGRPIFDSKKDLREFLARSKGENETYYHEWD